MKTLRILAPATLALFVSSCASAPAESAPAGNGAPAAAGDGDKAAELQTKLDKAGIKLEIARIDAKNGEAASARSVEAATLEAELAASALENYRTVLQPIEAAASELSLDGARQRVKESQEELQELEKMYAQEEFADLTKELVLTRGRAQLQMAQRNLELTEKRAAQARTFEWPRKERELSEKVASTQRALEEAQSRAAKGALERKLALLEAEEAVAKAQKELEAPAEDAS
jgi:hypothetical protein